MRDEIARKKNKNELITVLGISIVLFFAHGWLGDVTVLQSTTKRHDS